MERELFDPGWHRDIEDERYHKSGGISSTSLKYLLQRAPNYFLYKQQNKSEPTAAMRLGSLIHAMVLEPDTVGEKYVEMPDFGDQRRTANKEAKKQWLLLNDEKESFKPEQFDQASKIAKSVLSHPVAASLLDSAIVESSIYWWYKGDYEDERKYKQMCKVRPDAISVTSPGTLVDLKTTEDASFSSFARSIHKYLYHMSAAMYLEGVNSCDELLSETKAFLFTNFVWIAVEKEPPYNVACYSISKNDLALGRALFRKGIQTLHDAKQDDFPGYPEEIREIELPQFAQNGHIV